MTVNSNKNNKGVKKMTDNVPLDWDVWESFYEILLSEETRVWEESRAR